MKCLSLKQPFAELLVSGRKTIELRPWNTNFRGEFLVQASKAPDSSACAAFGFDPKKMVKGAIIGKAVIYGVKRYGSAEELAADREKHLATSGRYIDSRYGFLLKDAKRISPPIPIKGQLNFFDVEL